MERSEEVARALDGHKASIAALVKAFEDRRPEARSDRAEIIALLEVSGRSRRARFVGITGTPGAGKSSLVAEVTRDLLEADAELRLGVVAVDPSSRFSGGSLLGDRTRIRGGRTGERMYFRSQAADRDLGGLGPTTFQVCRLFYHLFDLVFVETVGIGQSEIDVRLVADRVFLVLQPLAGDEVQFLKAGIMEVPDEILLNKCDAADAAARSYQALRASLKLARPFDGGSVPVHRVSAKTGLGLDALAEHLRETVLRAEPTPMPDKEARYFEKWARDEWGRQGALFYAEAIAEPRRYLAEMGGYDAAQEAFGRALVRSRSE